MRLLFRDDSIRLTPAANVSALDAIDQKQNSFAFSGIDVNTLLTTKRRWATEYLAALGTVSKATSATSPMTLESLTRWLQRAADPQWEFPGIPGRGSDWSWEGICHGWAAASLMAEEPKHAVAVELPAIAGKNKTLFFTEGDIRALLSRAWSDDSTKDKFFVGRRCNENLFKPEAGVPSNAEGRAISGTLRYQASNGQFLSSPFTIVQDYPRAGGRAALYRIILEREWTAQRPRFAYLQQQDAQNPNSPYSLTFNEEEAFAALTSAAVPNSVHAVREVQIFGCWDVNPASLHTLLVKNLAEKNIGIVMDRSQGGQVWNQPIARAEFKIEGLQSISSLGDKDAGKYYRAPGTAYVVGPEIFHYSLKLSLFIRFRSI